MEQITLEVKGMSCGHCVKSVEGSVGALDGVETVKVFLDNGTVEIKFDASKVTVEQLKETIDDQGYDVA